MALSVFWDNSNIWLVGSKFQFQGKQDTLDSYRISEVECTFGRPSH